MASREYHQRWRAANRDKARASSRASRRRRGRVNAGSREFPLAFGRAVRGESSEEPLDVVRRAEIARLSAEVARLRAMYEPAGY